MSAFITEYLKGSRALGMIALILRICAVGIEVYIPLRIRGLAEAVSINQELIVLGLLTLIVFALMLLANRLSSKVACDVTSRIEMMFVNNQAWRYDSSLSSLGHDLSMLQQMLCSIQRLWVKAPVMLAFALMALSSIDMSIALVCAVTIIILLFGLRYLTREFSSVLQVYKKSEDVINTSSVAVYNSLESAVANRIDFGYEGISDLENVECSETNKVVANGMLPVSCNSWYMIISLSICTIVVCNSKNTNEFALGVLPAFMYLGMLLNSCQGIQRMLASATKLNVVIARLRKFKTVCVSESHEVSESDNRIIVNGDDELLAGSIESNIRFYRDINESAIEDIMQELCFTEVFQGTVDEIKVRDARSLSSGQRQLVLIARGLVHPTGCTLKNCMSSIDENLKSRLVSILTKGGIDFE